jgi:hypothetical protein
VREELYRILLLIASAMTLLLLTMMACGCGQSAAEERFAKLVAAQAAAESLGEQAGIFADCPSPCVLKIGATWCGPCQTEQISDWLRRSKWTVHSYDCDRDAEFVSQLDCPDVPTFIVIRGHKEVARYTGTDINAFLPILKAACQ